MTSPVISIVTPSFNQAAYLEKTIQSVLRQQIPGMEYFVMDGGSTDGSKEILRKYADQLTGWVSESDRGQGDGINKGFRNAKGEIFAWINSDDFYLKNTFETVLDYFEQNPGVDLIYGDVLSIDAEGKLINVMKFHQYSLQDLMTFRIISQPAVFFRKSAWERAGGMNLHYHYLLDHQLWLRIALQGEIAYLPKPLAAARFYPEAKNRAHAAEFGKEAHQIAQWLLSDPQYAFVTDRLQRKITGGADWLDANYLSNAGKPAAALRSYLKAFWKVPSRVWEDRRRAALTLLMWFDPRKAEAVFNKKAQERLASQTEYQDLL